MALKSNPRLTMDPTTTSHASDDDDNDDDDDENDDEACFILDAKNYGSISRFYNHSCKPNVYIQNV